MAFSQMESSISVGVRQGWAMGPSSLVGRHGNACLQYEKIRIRDFSSSFHKIFYKGYADDTCCYVSNASGIRCIFDIFQVYKNVPGLKLNETKSTIIPFGSSIGDLPSANLPACRWLAPCDHEAILDVQIGSSYSDDVA
jgi:hypothetical protein